jgi:hypothetical protein
MYGERYPEIPPGEVLLDYWREIGFSGVGSVGVVPLTWIEVAAFVSCAGYDISAIEARCMVDMSRAYVASYLDTRPTSIEPMERNSG